MLSLFLVIIHHFGAGHFPLEVAKTSLGVDKKFGKTLETATDEELQHVVS